MWEVGEQKQPVALKPVAETPSDVLKLADDIFHSEGGAKTTPTPTIKPEAQPKTPGDILKMAEDIFRPDEGMRPTPTPTQKPVT